MLDNPVALALASALCFSLGLVLAQFGLARLRPAQGALVSVPTSTALLWLLSPVAVDWHGAVLGGAAIFVLVGLMFPATVTLLTFEANRRMGPTVAGALGNLTPLFALLVAALLFGEIPGFVQGLGIAAILIGVAVLTVDRRWGAQSWPWSAVLIPLGAAAIRGVAQPVTKFGLGLWPSPFAAVLLGYTVSSVMIIASGAIRAGAAPADFNRAGVAWFAAVGAANVWAVLLLYAALAQGSVSLVSPLVATYPLITLGLAALLPRTARLDARIAFGVALTVAGVTILIASR
jgi:drug/metabolite transporter (DMT)-like permease